MKNVFAKFLQHLISYFEQSELLVELRQGVFSKQTVETQRDLHIIHIGGHGQQNVPTS